MYQTKPTAHHQRKGKHFVVGFDSYYKVFRINSDVKRSNNMNTFAKKTYRKVHFFKIT